MKSERFCALAQRTFPWVVLSAFLLYFFTPFRYCLSCSYWDVPTGSDSILHAAIIKTVIETGWAFVNPRLGAPFGTEFYDFSGADVLFLVQIKALALFSSDPTVVMNLFYVSSFVLVFFTAYFVSRRLELSVLWATVLSIIYSLLPYHFLRGTNHLYLSNYFIVPLLIYTCLRIYPGVSNDKVILSSRCRWYHVLFLLAAGSAGVYYAFFGLMLIFFTGLLGSIGTRSWLFFRQALLVCSVIVLGVLINLAPSITYSLLNGKNVEAAERAPIESEIYGLRLGQLLLPIWGHQNEKLAKFARRYHESVVPSTEATSGALGVIGSAGFLFLFAVAIFGSAIVANNRVQVLAKLNLVAFSFSVVGGFGVLFSLFVTPQFRGMNRVSVFIAFISLLGLFLFVKDKGTGRNFGFLSRRFVTYAVAVLLIFLSLYDQVPLGSRRVGQRGGADSVDKINDVFRGFIGEVESMIPKGGMIYVFPYMAFPESPPLFEEGYNLLLRPYYYSSHAKWSYGAMRGRSGDDWLKIVDALSLPDKIDALESSGFEGVYIDRKAYKDHAVKLEAALSGLLKSQLFIESPDRQQVFYRLRPVQYPSITPSMSVKFGSGFYAEERDGDKHWLWSRRKSEISIYNYTNNVLDVSFSANIMALDSRNVAISHEGKAAVRTDLRAGEQVAFKVSLALRPGVNYVKFLSDSPDFHIPTDPRGFSVKLVQPEVTVE